MKSRPALILSLVVLCTCGPLPHAVAGVTCIERDGLEVCVQAMGRCDLGQLMPRERLHLELEMLRVTVVNKSERQFRVDPENFVGVTEGGQAVKLDIPMLRSIELRSVLRKSDLGPGEETSGHLFFPTWMGPVRTLLHRGSPTFQIRLY